MKTLCLIAVLASVCSASHAALAVGSGGGVASSATLNHVQAVTSAPPSMHRGVITALNLDGGEIDIHGNRLHVSRAVQLFSSSGERGTLSALRRGQEIRFLLDPKDTKERTILVIYLP